MVAWPVGSEWRTRRTKPKGIEMRKFTLTTLVAIFAVAFSGLAMADDIGNNVTVNTDGDRVITLDLADADIDGNVQHTVTFSYTTTDGDGKNGCNLGGQGSQVTFSIAAASGGTGAVPTLDTSSVQFLNCPPLNPAPTVTVTANAVGSNWFALSSSPTLLTTNHGTVTFNTTAATFLVTVIDSRVLAALDASEIANAHLKDRADGKMHGVDNEECVRLGTNKNKSNWHGVLISAVTKAFPTGGTWTAADVRSYVDAACGTGVLPA